MDLFESALPPNFQKKKKKNTNELKTVADPELNLVRSRTYQEIRS